MAVISPNSSSKRSILPNILYLVLVARGWIGEESTIHNTPRLPMFVMMGNDESTGGCEKAPPPLSAECIPHLWRLISTGAEGLQCGCWAQWVGAHKALFVPWPAGFPG